MNELTKRKIKMIQIKEIYWHDANYPNEQKWLSKTDVRLAVEELKKRIDNSSIDLGFNLINDLIDDVFSGVKK